MKLKALNEGYMQTFRDLNPRQIAVLIKLADGNFDYDTENPSTWATVASLQDHGLVDDALELTSPAGARAAELGKKFGSTDRREAGERDAKLGRTGGPAQKFTDTAEGDDIEGSDEPAPFSNQWGSVRDPDA